MDAGGVEEEGGRGGANVFGEAPVAPVSLNLTALMDILSNLLFFLLAAFGATVVMAINATVPVRSDKSDVAATRQTVTALVSVSTGALELTVTGTEQAQADLDRFRAHFAATPTGFDLAAFTKQLVSIKEEYPRSDTMILSAEPGARYESMIKIMDAARETTITVAGTPRLAPLFPTVVVSPGGGPK
jgi:biopolymer transport protein ExbD